MKTPLYGLILGGALGIFDGLSALVSAPEVAPQIVGIVVGSTIKGLITGVLIGVFARKVHSFPLGLTFGLAVGLVLAYGRVSASDIKRPEALLLADHATRRDPRAHRGIRYTAS